jgi:hypothetical protein
VAGLEVLRMRLILDTLVALMLAAILVGVVFHSRTDAEVDQARETTRLELRRFQQQISLQSALAKVERTERGYPMTIDPDWFQGTLPSNPLLGPEHPWVEIAGPDHETLMHPLERVASNKGIAKFWYNPYSGVVRARVPVGISDNASLDLYNFVNDAALPDLFADGARKNKAE